MYSLLPVIVIMSSIWVLFDAMSIGVKAGQIKGFFNMGPGGWFVGCLLVWIIVFPVYLVRRGQYQRINSGLFIACPTCSTWISRHAPACPHCGIVLAQAAAGELHDAAPGDQAPDIAAIDPEYVQSVNAGADTAGHSMLTGILIVILLIAVLFLVIEVFPNS